VPSYTDYKDIVAKYAPPKANMTADELAEYYKKMF